MSRVAIIEVSYSLLEQWLHLPVGVHVRTVVPGPNPRSCMVRLVTNTDFLPESEDGRISLGTLIVTEQQVTGHQPIVSVEFRAIEQ